MAGHLLTASGRSLNNFNGVTPNSPIEEGRPARVALLQYLLKTDQNALLQKWSDSASLLGFGLQLSWPLAMALTT